MPQPKPNGWILQKTLKSAIGCAGVGLHSGVRVRLTLRPAEPDTGIVFRRLDRSLRSSDVPALWSNIVDTKLCTTIGNEAGTRIATIEHLLAALCGAEIDNCIVELTGPEIPAMDGSAEEFMFLLDCAGVVEQDAPRRAIQAIKRVSAGHDDRSVAIEPASGFTVTFAIDFDAPAIARQSRSVKIERESFRAEIASARTFGFAADVARLRAAGLARGGSLANSVVVEGGRVLNQEGLRYDDEFVRHKILDCVGDLYLAGGPLLGHVRADRSGHRLNSELLGELFRRRDAWRRVDLTEDMLIAATPARRRPRLVAG